MKATCIAHIVFVHGGEEKFSVEITGEASLPCLVKQTTPDAENPNERPVLIEKKDGEEVFEIKEIGYVAQRGVWKPVIRLSPHNGDVKSRETPWKDFKLDIAETFLPGYKLFWDHHGQKPIDWVPPGFKELFDCE